MISHGSQIITDLRRGTWQITSMTRGTFDILGRFTSPYMAAATAALKAAFSTAQWETIRDYGLQHPEIVPYVNQWCPTYPHLIVSLVDLGIVPIMTRTTSSNGFDTGIAENAGYYHMMKILSTRHTGGTYYGSGIGNRFFGYSNNFYLDSGGTTDSANRISGGQWNLNEWYDLRIQFKCVYNNATSSVIIGSLSNTSTFSGTRTYKMSGEGAFKGVQIFRKSDNAKICDMVPVADNACIDIVNNRLCEGVGTYSETPAS